MTKKQVTSHPKDSTGTTSVFGLMKMAKSIKNCVISKVHVHNRLEINLLQNSLFGRLSRGRSSYTRGRPRVRITSGEARHKVALWFGGIEVSEAFSGASDLVYSAKGSEHPF